MKKVSCVIPAYNEASQISNVLRAVIGHPQIHEIIVVDDCSTDDTASIVEEYTKRGVQLISLEKNGGKAAALTRGVRASSGELLLFLDADLDHLTAEHITDLLAPVLENRADVSMSLRKNAPAPWHWIGIDYISGERLMLRTLIEQELAHIETLRPFGLEVYINSIFIKHRVRLAIVPWPQVESPFKYKKAGLSAGIRGDIHMMRDIFRTVSLWSIIRQIYIMRVSLAIS